MARIYSIPWAGGSFKRFNSELKRILINLLFSRVGCYTVNSIVKELEIYRNLLKNSKKYLYSYDI
jgi:hypothetical protein